MRTYYSIKNAIIGILNQSISLLLSFIVRTVFVIKLGEASLGLNGLFSNVLSMLSLAELGIGSAIIFSMYKPLAQKDEKKIKALMNLYSKVYSYIGLIVLLIGFLILPFLDVIMKNKPNIPGMEIIYLLFLINSGTTYFFAYKRSIIIADQKNYIVTTINCIFSIILSIIQIIVLNTTESFILFLLVKLISDFMQNIYITKVANKLYPFLKEKPQDESKLDKADKEEISKNVKAMIMHKLGGASILGSDNIIISAFVGVVWVGLYSNYTLIIGALDNLISQVFGSITASVGNLNVMESDDKKLEAYMNISFSSFWIHGFCAIALLNLFNIFIECWIGEKYALNWDVVLIIAVNYYLLNGIRNVTLTFISAMGLFWFTRYNAFLAAIINIVASIILAGYLGIKGVLIGTTISLISTCIWFEPYMLFKHGFHKSVLIYFKKYLQYSFSVIISAFITTLICLFFNKISWVTLIERGIVCIIIPNVIFYIWFRKTSELKYLLSIIKKILGFKKIIKYLRVN